MVSLRGKRCKESSGKGIKMKALVLCIMCASVVGMGGTGDRSNSGAMSRLSRAIPGCAHTGSGNQSLVPDLFPTEPISYDLESAEALCDLGERYLVPFFSESIALKAFKRALQIDQTYARAYNGLGWAYLTRIYAGIFIYKEDVGAWKSAIEAFNSAIALEPAYSDAYLGRAQALHSLGRYDEAIRNYQQTISINSYSAESYGGLGRIYEKLGSYEEAKEALLQMMQTKVARALIGKPAPYYASDRGYDDCFFDYMELGRLLVNMSQYQEAIDAFKSAIALKPGDSNGRFHLGLAYISAGDRQAALEQYNEILSVSEKAQDEFSRAECMRYAENLLRRIPDLR